MHMHAYLEGYQKDSTYIKLMQNTN